MNGLLKIAEDEQEEGSFWDRHKGKIIGGTVGLGLLGAGAYAGHKNDWFKSSPSSGGGRSSSSGGRSSSSGGRSSSSGGRSSSSGGRSSSSGGRSSSSGGRSSSSGGRSSSSGGGLTIQEKIDKDLESGKAKAIKDLERERSRKRRSNSSRHRSMLDESNSSLIRSSSSRSRPTISNPPISSSNSSRSRSSSNSGRSSSSNTGGRSRSRSNSSRSRSRSNSSRSRSRSNSSRSSWKPSPPTTTISNPDGLTTQAPDFDKEKHLADHKKWKERVKAKLDWRVGPDDGKQGKIKEHIQSNLPKIWKDNASDRTKKSIGWGKAMGLNARDKGDELFRGLRKSITGGDLNAANQEEVREHVKEKIKDLAGRNVKLDDETASNFARQLSSFF